MGHFVKTDVAAAHVFNESMNAGEDVDYYLRVWGSAKCVKIPAVLFLNRRGLRSSAPRAATAEDWSRTVNSLICACRAERGGDPARASAAMSEKMRQFGEFAARNGIEGYSWPT